MWSLLALVFLAYYIVSFYVPDLLKQYSKLINMIVKDLLMIIVVILIYFKEVKKDFKSFKRSKNKFMLVIWAIAIIAAFVCLFRQTGRTA